MSALKAASFALKKAAANAGSNAGGNDKQGSPTTGVGDDKKSAAKWGDARKKAATSAVLGK